MISLKGAKIRALTGSGAKRTFSQAFAIIEVSGEKFVTVSSTFDFDDEVVVCTFNVVSTTYGNGDGYGNSNNSYNAYFIISGAVVLFGAVAHGIRRRCRRITTADDCNDIHEVVMSRVLSHPFERMGKEESTRSLPQTC